MAFYTSLQYEDFFFLTTIMNKIGSSQNVLICVMLIRALGITVHMFAREICSLIIIMARFQLLLLIRQTKAKINHLVVSTLKANLLTLDESGR